VIIILFILAFCSINAQIVINEVQFLPRTNEPEWIELYNNSNTIFSDSLSISDLNGTKQLGLVNIPAKSYLVVCSDSNALKVVYGEGLVILQKSIPSLNNDFDALILKSKSVILDSIYYNGKWTEKPFTLERVNPELTVANQSNWKKSLHPNGGTPSKENTHQKKNFNIALDSIQMGNDSLYIYLSNNGINLIPKAELYFEFIPKYRNNIYKGYKEINFTTNQSTIALSYIEFSENNFGNGNLKVNIKSEFDNLPFDDSLFQKIYISYPKNSLLINEFLFEETDSIPEFIELYNNYKDTLYLDSIKFVESNLLSKGSYLLINSFIPVAPDSLITITKDSLITIQFDTIPRLVVTRKSFDLNSVGTEIIRINDYKNILLDSLSYNKSWHSEYIANTKGISLEKLSPKMASDIKLNWQSSQSTLGGTPSKPNSYIKSNIEKQSIIIDPNPYDRKRAINGLCQIEIKTNFLNSKATCQIYNINGLLQKTLANSEISGSSIILTWDGTDDKGQAIDSGLYILYYRIIDIGSNNELEGKELLLLSN